MDTEQDAPEQEPSDLEKAQQLVAQHNAQRLQAFEVELDQLCARYGVQLGTTPAQITMRIAD